MRIRRAAAATALALAAGGALAVAPAHADTPPLPTTTLVLTVSGPGAATPGGDSRGVTLTCSPTTSGDHPEAATACGQLAGAGGDFAALPTRQLFCPDIYLPVTATAVGLWSGTPVFFQRTYPNHCTLLRATGRVFDF